MKPYGRKQSGWGGVYDGFKFCSRRAKEIMKHWTGRARQENKKICLESLQEFTIEIREGGGGGK